MGELAGGAGKWGNPLPPSLPWRLQAGVRQQCEHRFVYFIVVKHL